MRLCVRTALKVSHHSDDNQPMNDYTQISRGIWIRPDHVEAWLDHQRDHTNHDSDKDKTDHPVNHVTDRGELVAGD